VLPLWRRGRRRGNAVLTQQGPVHFRQAHKVELRSIGLHDAEHDPHTHAHTTKHERV
jgi:hypothetical protein